MTLDTEVTVRILGCGNAIKEIAVVAHN